MRRLPTAASRSRPGCLTTLVGWWRCLSTIAAAGGNVIDVQHIRDIGTRGFHETRIEMLLEVRGTGHREALLAELADAGYEVVVLEPSDDGRVHG